MGKAGDEMNYRSKILLAIAASCAAVAIIISVALYTRSASMVWSNYYRSLRDSLDSRAIAFDEIMREAYYAAVNASCDKEIAALAAKAGNGEKLAERLEIYKQRYSVIDSIYFYFDKDNSLTKVTQYGTMQSVQDTAAGNFRKQLFSADSLTPVSVKDDLSAVRKQLFSYAKDVKDNKTGERLGTIVVNVDERTVFFKCVQSINRTSDGNAYIVSPDGRLVSDQNVRILGDTADLTAQKGYLTVSNKMSLTDYFIFCTVPESTVVGSLNSVRNYSLVAVLVVVAISLIPIIFLSRSMYKPIKSLKEAMERVSSGDLDARVQVYQKDEFGQLSEDFNSMTEKISTLISELVTEKLLKKEAELEALQYQITPHFMYNTLNSIKYAAILQNAPKIGQLLGAFIELLQMSASKRGAFLTVKDEVHLVKNYVTLQQFRYMDSFEVEYDVSEAAEIYYVPRLILQPLVENSILHGLDTKKTGSRITVSAAACMGEVVLTVTDNGRGMNSEEIAELLSGEKKSKFSGIGVSNIQDRLKLYYGDKGRLQYISDGETGTKAIIILPAASSPEAYSL